MIMEKLTYIILVLVLILYLKWILLLIFYPLQVGYNLYQCNKNNIIYKVSAVPLFLLNKFLRGGINRFLDYNISTFPSNHIRKWFYKGLGAKIGNNVIFHFETEIRCHYKLKIGKGSIIGDNAILDARSGLELGENVNISSNVSIYTLQHDHRNPYFACPTNKKMNVTIKNRVWLGSNVIVLPGVTIGEGAVCCAGCVVTKDIEPYTVVAGIPAKKVGERPKNLIYEFKGKTCRFY